MCVPSPVSSSSIVVFLFFSPDPTPTQAHTTQAHSAALTRVVTTGADLLTALNDVAVVRELVEDISGGSLPVRSFFSSFFFSFSFFPRVCSACA